MKPVERKILAALQDRALDIHDIKDELKLPIEDIFDAMRSLHERDLIDWNYVQDEASLTPAGREAMKEKRT